MGYNIINYWNSREEPNSVNTITNTDLINKQINFFSSYFKEEMKVLDIGPGTGRLAKAFKKVHLTVFDISEIYKDKLLQEYKKHEIDIEDINIEKKPWVKLPYPTNKFDIVTTSLVLLHQPPPSIKNFISEMCRVGKKVVCISTKIKGSAPHVFNHDYKKIVGDLGLLYEEMEITDIGQIYFIIKSKEYGN